MQKPDTGYFMRPGMQEAALDEAEAMPGAAETEINAEDTAGGKKRFFRKLSFPHFSDKSQQKAFGYILRFLAVMLIFTVVARGTASATLPKVDLTAPFRSEIINSIDITGTVEAAYAESAELPPFLSVKSILVTPGQQVKAGDPLAGFDIAEVAGQRKREELKLDEMELNLQKLLRGEPYDESALTAAVAAAEWAKQDLEAAQENGQAMLHQAQGDLRLAEQALAKAQTHYDSIFANPGAGKDEKDTAFQAWEAAKTTVGAAETALADAQKMARADADAASRALEMAEQNLSSVQTAESAARQAAADNRAQNQIDAENIRLDMESQKRIIALYDAISQDGIVHSDKEGAVLAVAEPGAKTGEGDIITMADANAGFQVVGVLPQANAEKLAVGSTAEIQTSTGYFEDTQAGAAKLVSMSDPDENNLVTVFYSLEEGGWQQGQTLSLKVTQNRQEYDACVPLSAIRQDQNGTHVLVMEESSGILGVEIIVRAVPVTVLADDGSTAAISGDVGFGRTIVSASSKPVSDGDKVRVNL